MTFDEIVSDVTTRLNLPSAAATTRVGIAVNALYKRLTASLGIDAETRRVTTTAVTGDTPFVTFSGIEKAISVKNADGDLLTEASQAELDAAAFGDTSPSKWAVYRVGSGSVTLQLDATADSPEALTVLGYDRQDTLSGAAVPAFPESFHYVLVEGVLAQELRKLEKPALAEMARREYEQGLSDLRMFLAKSRHLPRVQGRLGTASTVIGSAGVSTSATDFVFLQNGSGAVSRSAQEKMREIVSILDWATPQDALNAVSGSGQELYVPAGDYTLTEPWLVKDNTHLRLSRRARIIRNFSGLGSENATIRNADLDLGGVNITIKGGEFLSADSGKEGKHLGFRGVVGLDVIGPRFTSVYGDWNTAFGNCEQVRVLGVRINTPGDGNRDGLHFSGGNGILIADCIIYSGDDALSFTNEDFGAFVADPLFNVRVVNCILNSSHGALIRIEKEATETNPIYGISISDIAGTKAGATTGGVVRIIDEGADGSIRDIAIARAHLDCSEAFGNGIELTAIVRPVLEDVQALAPQGIGVLVDTCERPILRRVRTADNRGASVQGILLQDCTDVLVEAPETVNSTHHGLQIGATSAPVTRGVVRNVLATGCTLTGLRVFNATGVHFEHVRSTGNDAGIVEDSGSSLNHFSKLDYAGNTSTGASLQQTAGTRSDEWRTPTFAAGNFTGSGSMTWTVAAGDVGTFAYRFVDKTMVVAFTINTTTVGGTPSTSLRMLIPGGRTAAKTMLVPCVVIDNGTRGIGYASVTAAGTTIDVQLADFSNWAAATDATYVMGEIAFEVQ